jgi:YidC/Oxa1 family membrane protein insertase
MTVLFDIIIYPIKIIFECVYMILSTSIFKGNIGIALAGLSVTINMICLPLYIKSEQLQRAERDIQKKLARRVAGIKRWFKGDEQYMILSMYYRENHYHPIMALRSSLSLLIQIPFFIAAYSFLSNLDSLEGKSLFFINNLGAPDALFSVQIFSFLIPVNILPILMTVINCIAGLIYSRGFSFKEKAQLYAMALVFLVLLYNSPSALVVYWTMNNIFSLVKNILFKMKNPRKAAYAAGLVLLLSFAVYVLFFRYNEPRRALRNKAFAVLLFFLFSGIPGYIHLAKKAAASRLRPFFANFNNRKIIFLLACVNLWLLIGCLIPSNLAASDAAQFAADGGHPFWILLSPAVQALGLFIFWPVYFFLLAPKNVRSALSALFAGLAFCGLLNFFVFQGHYGTVSRELSFNAVSDLSGTALIRWINIIAAAGVFVLLYCLVSLKKTNWILAALSISLIGSLFLSGFKLYQIDAGLERNTAKAVQEESAEEIVPVFELSETGKNVFIIMLDAAVNSYFPLFLEEKPGLKEQFDGFVYYPNTVSFFRNTIFGAPPLFGGYEYTTYELNKRTTETIRDKHVEAMFVLPTIFSGLGFSTTLTNMSYMDPDSYAERGINAKNTIGLYNGKYIRDVLGLSEYTGSPQTGRLLKRNILFLSLLEASVYSLRNFIYQHGRYWGAEDFSLGSGVPLSTMANYAALHYLPQLTSVAGGGDTFSIMVNELTHEPAYLQYPGYTAEAKISDLGADIFGDARSLKNYHVNAASYTLLVKWFEYLRLRKLWDNTRIIIVSDHGDTNITNPEFSAFQNTHVLPYNPILLFKDFNDSSPLRTDNKFMTNADVPLLALKDIAEKALNPFTGKILEEDKSEGVYIFTEGYANPSRYPGAACLEDNSKFYFVRDSIFKNENWKELRYRDFKTLK